MSIIYSQIIVYILVVVVTSAIVGFLSERPKEKNIEGFTGTDENIEALNADMSEKVSNMDDNLHVTKYKKDYENTLTYGKDYFNSMTVASLFDFSTIIKEQRDKEKTEKSLVDLAKKLGALHEGSQALKNTQL